MDERLGALRDSKRVVELKYQNNLMEKSSLESKIACLNQSNELMQVIHKFSTSSHTLFILR